MTGHGRCPKLIHRNEGQNPMEIAVFARLEQKVEALLERLAALKEENSELMKLYNEKDSEATELKRQLAAQEAEREQVRQRIENLVAKLEQI